jgi:hypothetical protein
VSSKLILCYAHCANTSSCLQTIERLIYRGRQELEVRNPNVCLKVNARLRSKLDWHESNHKQQHLSDYVQQ